jgi:hypothetical protein
MTKKFAVALALALLTVAAPARAYTFTTENIFLDFGNSYTATGSITYFALYYPPYNPNSDIYPTSQINYFNLYVNQSPLPSWFIDPGLGNPFKLQQTGFDLDPPNGVVGIITWPLDHPPTSFADFALNGTPAISGDVSPVPLPAALPLFGSAILGLAGLAWRRGKVSA